MPSFEQSVRALLDKHFACCALSKTPIFRPDAPEHREKGYEMDHLLRVRPIPSRQPRPSQLLRALMAGEKMQTNWVNPTDYGKQ